MKLLNPKEIKDDKSESLEQTKRIINKFSKEESRLAIMINNARDKAKKVIKKNNEELDDFKNQIKIKKSILEQEVIKLKEIRNKLLEPVDKIKLEAEGYLEEAKQQLIDVNLKEKELEKLININKDRKIKDNIREKNIKKQENEIEKIISNLNKREKEISNLEKTLKNNWDKYKLEIQKLNNKVDALSEKESQLNIQEQAIEDRKLSQDKRDKELLGIKQGLESERDAIKQAKIHLGIKL